MDAFELDFIEYWVIEFTKNELTDLLSSVLEIWVGMNLIFFSSFSFELDILPAVASEIQVQNSFKLEKVLSSTRECKKKNQNLMRTIGRV